MNRGAQQLAEHLKKHGEKKRFADWLTEHGRGPKVDAPTVSHWLAGDRKPTPQQRALIEDQYGIGWRTWDDEAASEKGAA